MIKSTGIPKETKTRIIPNFTVRGLIIFVICGAIMASIWFSFVSWDTKVSTVTQKQKLAKEILPYERSLEVQLSRRWARLAGLSGFAKSKPSLENIRDEFTHFSAGLFAVDTGIMIMTIAPGGVVAYGYPEAAAENLIGRDIINDKRPDVRRDIKETIAGKTMTIMGPYDLVIGGRGLVGRDPIYNHDGSFRALVTMSFTIDKLLKDSGFDKLPRDVRTAIRDKKGNLLYGDKDVFSNNPVTKNITVPGGEWQIGMIPQEGWSVVAANAIKTEKLVAAVIAFLIALMLAGFIDRQFFLGREISKVVSDLEHAASFPRINPSPIVEFSRSGLLLFNNEAATRALEMAGIPEQYTAFLPDDLEAITKFFAQNPKTTSRYYEKDIGKNIYGETVTYNNDFETIRIYTLDITEKKRYEQELIKRQDDLTNTNEQIRKTLDDTVNAIAALAEHKDPYTAGHERKVVDLVLEIGKEMGLDEDTLDGLRVAATLHDVGKMYIPAEILSKPGRLSELEFSMIKVHPQYSFEVLSKIKFPWPVAEIAYQHHERVDGSGYPKGLKDSEILIEAKILAVADVVEAMASHRPYRQALPIEEAIDEVKNNAGKLYDEDVVKAMLKIYKSGYKI